MGRRTLAISVNTIKPSAHTYARSSTSVSGRGVRSERREASVPKREGPVRPWPRPNLSMESFALWPSVHSDATRAVLPTTAPILPRNRFASILFSLTLCPSVRPWLPRCTVYCLQKLGQIKCRNRGIVFSSYLYVYTCTRVRIR